MEIGACGSISGKLSPRAAFHERTPAKSASKNWSNGWTNSRNEEIIGYDYPHDVAFASSEGLYFEVATSGK